MQKRVLACLLASPLALNALADITVNGDLVNGGTGWTQTGISGGDIFSGTGVNCPFLTGVLETSINVQSPGTYKIAFTNSSNIKVTITGDGVEQLDEESFKVSAANTTVAIRVESADKINGFSFDKAELVIVVDFDAIRTQLKTNLDAIQPKTLPEGDDKRAEAIPLWNQYNGENGLNAQWKALDADVAKVAYVDASTDLKVYNEFRLWETPNTIQAAIDALKPTVESYNEAVDAETEVWDNIVKPNLDNYAALQAEITALEADLATQKGKLDEANAQVTEGAWKEAYDINMKASNDAYNAALEALNAYKAAVAEAYPDPQYDLDEKVIEFESQKDTLQAKINKIGTEMDTAAADWTAYKALMDLQAQLSTAASETNAALDKLDTESNDVYNNYIAAQKLEVNKLYNNALNAVVIKSGNPVGAAKASAADTQLLNDAINAIKNILTQTQQKIADTDEAYTNAMADVQALQDELNKVRVLFTLPEAQQKDFQALVKAAQDLINALKAKIEAGYSADVPSIPEYTEDVTAINEAIQAVKDFNAAWAPIANLWSQYYGLKGYVKQLQQESEISKDEFDLDGKFAGTYTTITNAINALGDMLGSEDFSEADFNKGVEDVVKGIEDSKTNAKNLMDAYKAASVAVKEFSGAIDALDKEIAGKLIVKGSTWTADAFKSSQTYSALVQTLKGFQKNLQIAAGASAQDAYDKCVELHQAIVDYGWQVNVNEVTEAFEVASTQVGNYKAVDNAIKALKENAGIGNEEVAYDGKPENFDDLDTELKAAKEAIDALVAGYTGDEAVDTKAWGEIDVKLNDLLGKVDAKNTEINALKDNQKAYDDLMTLFAPSLQNALDELIEYNGNYSLTPAKEYYANLINGEGNEESLQAQVNALEAEIQQALKDRKAKELQSSLQGKINNMSKAISDMKIAIQANNSNHDAQLAKSDEVRQHILDVIAYIESHDKGNVVPTWNEDLQKLMNEDLANVDLDVNKFYGVGQSAKENAGLIKRYEDIMAKADEFKAGFNDNVEATNNATIDAAEWEAAKAAMNAAYDQAIQQYNSFFALDNQTYREYILGVVKTHVGIYQYSADIAKLIADVKSWVNDKNTHNEVFTRDEFEAEANNKAAAMIDEIHGKVANMMTDANKAAQKFWNNPNPVVGEEKTNIHPKAQAAISDAEAQMVNAEISEEIRTAALTVANNDLAAMEKIYNGTPAEGETPAVPGAPDASDAEAMATSTFCLYPMNSIANIYDDLMKSIDVEKAAQDQWKETYDAADETLTALTEQLKGIVDAGDPSIETLAGLVAEAVELNSTATSDPTLIDHLVADTDELNRILADAQALVDEKQAAYDNDQANKDAADGYAAALVDLNNGLDALKVFAGSVAGGAGYNFSNIEGLIAYYETLYTETYKSSLVANKAVIDGALQAAKDAIENAYKEVKDKEQNALLTLLADTKVAFNNAKVIEPHTLTDEQLAEINGQINDLATDINDLNGVAVPDKKDEYSTTAQSLEKQLSDIYVKLMNSYESTEGVEGGDPLPAILADLNKTYDAVSAVITAAQEYLASCLETVQENPDFKGKFEAFAAQLKGIQDTYSVEGSTLVITKGRYVAQMEAIKAAVQALDAEVKAAQEIAAAEKAKIDADQAAFDSLTAELDGYQAQLDALIAEAQEHQVYGAVKVYADNAQHYIDLDRDWLATQHADINLNAESSLNHVGRINTYLKNLLYSLELNYIDAVNESLGVAMGDALSALGQNLVPEIKAGLETRYNNLYSRWENVVAEANDTLNKFRAGEITAEEYQTAMHKVADDLNSIKDDAEALTTDANANTFVLGDVNLDPDGEVNVVDVQIVLNWVAEDMTYEKLYEENARQACAADVTGGKELNIADVTKMISMILSQDAESDENSAPVMAPRRTVAASQGVYGMDMVSSEGTAREYVMALSGVNSFVGAQVDVKLPIGMTLEGVELADASTDHEVIISDNGNGNYRLVIYSMSNSTLNAVDGVMLRIHTEGIGTPEMDNVIFADELGNAEQLKKGGSSAIDTIINEARNLRDRIYDVSGKVMRKIQKGINIIRHSDGSTTKEMH